MANEIIASHTTGATLYAVVMNAVGQVLAGTTPETPVAANWGTYSATLAEASTTGIYRGDFPAVAAGTYGVSVHRQAGGSPATTDPVVASGEVQWSGTAVVPLSDIQARLPAALVGGRMDVSVGAMAANVLTAAAVADGAIDRATFAADTGFQSSRSGTAQAGSSTSITLDASASAVTDFYKDGSVRLTGGTGVGQARWISAYNGTTKVATVSPAWATTPDATTTFAVSSAASMGEAVLSTLVPGHAANTLGNYVDVQSVSLSTLISRLTAARAGYIDNLSAGAVALQSTAAATQVVAVKLDAMIVADGGDWQFDANALELAPSGGGGSADWTAGELEQIRHRLGIDGTASAPAATPSLATAAALATVDDFLDTEVAAIKAKTDNLPADPASNTQVNTRSSHSAADVASAVSALVVEGSTTLVMSLRGINAATMGKASGLDTGSPIYRDLADTRDRLAAACDSFGNRSSVTRDLT